MYDAVDGPAENGDNWRLNTQTHYWIPSWCGHGGGVSGASSLIRSLRHLTKGSANRQAANGRTTTTPVPARLALTAGLETLSDTMPHGTASPPRYLLPLLATNTILFFKCTKHCDDQLLNRLPQKPVLLLTLSLAWGWESHNYIPT